MDFSVLPNNNHPDKFLQLDVKSLVKNSAFLQASLAKFPEAVFPGAQQWHNKVYLQVKCVGEENAHHAMGSCCTQLRHCFTMTLVKSVSLPARGRATFRVMHSIYSSFFNMEELKREKKSVFERPCLELSGVSPVMIDRALGKHITTITLKSTIKSNPLYADIQTDDDWEERKRKPSWTVQDYDKHSLHSNLANYLKENPNDLQFWMGDIYTPGYDTLLKKKEREKKHSKLCIIILLVVLVVCILIAIVIISIFFT